MQFLLPLVSIEHLFSGGEPLPGNFDCDTIQTAVFLQAFRA